MFYLVRYAVECEKKIEFYNSLFIHSNLSSAREEALSKKYFGKNPVVDFYITILILDEEV